MRGQNNKTNKSKGKKPAAKRSAWSRFVRGTMLATDLMVAGALLLTGYAGYVSPLSHSAWWGVFPLAFSIVFWVAILMLVLQLIWYRPGAAVLALTFVCCGGPALTYCPLNIFNPKAPDDAEKLSLLTYNTCSYILCTDEKPEIAEYILSQDADIVTLQESSYLVEPTSGPRARALADSLRRRYPHISFGGATGNQPVLSKYPIEPIHLDVTRGSFYNGDLSAYRVILPTGRRLAIFNVHLQSFRLARTSLRSAAENDSDRQIVFEKLRAAACDRVRQINKLQQWLRLYGGPDVIISGDFNDVQGCYSIHSLGESGFESVYPRVGFGPMITYNDRHLYFRIDHILTRGAIKPLSIKRGSIKASDHYPLTAQFALE